MLNNQLEFLEKKHGKTSKTTATKPLKDKIAEKTKQLSIYTNFDARFAGLLKHEQGHYDIGEIFAKALRMEFKSLRVAVLIPAKKQTTQADIDKATADGKKALLKLAESRLPTYANIQLLVNGFYDGQNQANHGMNAGPGGQPEWNNWIANGLSVNEDEDEVDFSKFNFSNMPSRK
jgi:hypothetical protein